MSDELHQLLARQLRKLGLDARHAPSDAVWSTLIASIDRTYRASDQDRYTLERAIEISSEEMKALHQREKSSYEARLKAIFISLSDLLWLKDAKGVYLACNPMFERFFGAKESEIVGKTDYDFVDRALADSFRERDRIAIEADAPTMNEEWVTFADDGHRALLETVKTPVRDVSGKLIGVLGIARDITERKQAEEELRRYKEHLEDEVQQRTAELNSLFLAIPDLYFRMDRDGVILDFRAGHSEDLYLKPEQFLGKKMQEVMPPEVGKKFRSALRKIAAGEPVRAIEYELHLPGGMQAFEARLFPLEPHHVVSVVRNTTPLKRALTELIRARDAAESANRAKSVFLANMSHELRTPLNAILGFSTMLQNNPDLTRDQREEIAIINRSGNHLLTLINDVLEVAKIEAGRIELEEAAFDLVQLVEDVVDMMRLRAEKQGLQLLTEEITAVPRYIVGDQARLRQILINLVGNAIKFTKQGGVTLRLGVRPNHEMHLLIEVEDSGIGIAPEDRQRIFEPFVQLGEHAVSKGTGLGLTITRQFVKLMGGSIELESEPGKGSLFRIVLPLREATEADIVKPSAQETRNVIGLVPGQTEYRILIAEDQPENQLLLARLLADLGLPHRIAQNGENAVEQFRSWKPHLILMDQRMPVMSGMEAMQAIRKLPGGDEVRIVAVTASAFREQRDEMLAAGMNGFIGKPYRPSEIYDCLAEQLGVQFLYEGGEKKEKPAAALTPEMLENLPEELCRELKDALESLDGSRIRGALHKVGAKDAALEASLAALVDDYDYPAILDALTKCAP